MRREACSLHAGLQAGCRGAAQRGRRRSPAGRWLPHMARVPVTRLTLCPALPLLATVFLRCMQLWFRVPSKIYHKAGCLEEALGDLKGKERAVVITGGCLCSLLFPSCQEMIVFLG